jgi:hypothetical protein
MNIARGRRPVPFNINGSNRFAPALSCKIDGSSVTVSVHTKKINLYSKPVKVKQSLYRLGVSQRVPGS